MLESVSTVTIEVADPSDNAYVIYETRRLLERMGFDRNRVFLIAAAVSELATNIVRYGEKGEIILGEEEGNGEKAFVVIARDSGPGITYLHKAMKDNYTTGKGLGLGLPSVKRIMDDFEIQTEPGVGTCVTAKKWIKQNNAP